MQQKLQLKYVNIEVLAYGDIDSEVKIQLTKATRMAACLNNAEWRMKYVGIEKRS